MCVVQPRSRWCYAMLIDILRLEVPYGLLAVAWLLLHLKLQDAASAVSNIALQVPLDVPEPW